MVGNARDWIVAHRAEITLSLRITVAGLIALVIGELLGVRQVYWAVLAAVIVMQASVGGSLKATLDRLAGTIAGALWGATLGAVIPHPGPLATAGLLVAALLPLAGLVAWWPSYRVAPVTAIIVLLVLPGDAGPVQAAIERLIEIALGCAVALGVALAITPSRAHRLLSGGGRRCADPDARAALAPSCRNHRARSPRRGARACTISSAARSSAMSQRQPMRAASAIAI